MMLLIPCRCMFFRVARLQAMHAVPMFRGHALGLLPIPCRSCRLLMLRLLRRLSLAVLRRILPLAFQILTLGFGLLLMVVFSLYRLLQSTVIRLVRLLRMLYLRECLRSII